MTITADEVQTRSASAKAVFVEWFEMLSTHHPPQARSRRRAAQRGGLGDGPRLLETSRRGGGQARRRLIAIDLSCLENEPKPL